MQAISDTLGAYLGHLPPGRRIWPHACASRINDAADSVRVVPILDSETRFGILMPDKPFPALLSKDDLCTSLGISKRTIENMVRDGTFPPPVRLGKCVYWSEVAVHSWQRRLFAGQEAWQG